MEIFEFGKFGQVHELSEMLLLSNIGESIQMILGIKVSNTTKSHRIFSQNDTVKPHT